MFLDKYIKENGVASDFPVFDGKISKDIFVSPVDLLHSQYNDNDFNAVDIVIKYLAIENVYGLNDFGFALYDKTQYRRTGKDWHQRFEDLITSVEFGYDNSSFVETDLNYSIHDGAHRTALALFHNFDIIPLRLFNTYLYRRTYDIKWFEENDFSKKELELIKYKLNTLLEKYSDTYYCILWPPARNFFDNIQNSLSELDPNLVIISSEDIIIPKHYIKQFIYDIYSTDDIKLEKLDIKFLKMMNSLSKDNFDMNGIPIKIIKFKMKYPDFRVKPLTGLPQSKTTMKIKQTIRDSYKQYITDYYYDIIMHITDNSIQNKEVEKIITKIGEFK